MTRAPARLPLLLIGLCALAAPATGGAWVVMQEITVPVEVRTAAGEPVSREIHVGAFHENTSHAPRPILVLNHGRAPSAEGRATVAVRDLEDAARWLTKFGFIVAVPIRIGYGRTGGEDVENSGPCAKKSYPPVYHAAAVQTVAVVEALRRRPDASRDRAVIMGQSFGGTTALAVAAMNPPGIQGAINFAGGGGGNPVTRPQNPCSPKALRNLFEHYGRTARMPTLWIYSENDRYFGPEHPRAWFAAFRGAGGRGEFVQLPPVGDDGHRLFYREPRLWQPKVSEFLASLGFRPQ